MKEIEKAIQRRDFVRNSCLLAAGGILPSWTVANKSPESVFMIGRTEGYSPQIGALVSMLNYNRFTIEDTVKGLTQKELDFLIDPQANTIGALLLHLGSTDKYFQINTFEGREEFNEAEKKEWGAASELGDLGRKEIKGHDVNYYLERINAVRKESLEKLKGKDDDWLMQIDRAWSKPGKELNTYWKWFHVCEHESNHRGQIVWIKRRLPGAPKSDSE